MCLLYKQENIYFNFVITNSFFQSNYTVKVKKKKLNFQIEFHMVFEQFLSCEMSIQ